MTQEAHKVVKESGGMRIIIANSATSITADNKNDIVISGSHCGANVANDYMLPNGVRGMIGNDAGIGMEDAGIASLKILEEHGVPAAAVAASSAEIGVGQSTYDEGIISTVNQVARNMGVTVGMTTREAADKIFNSISRQNG
jgi:hypothetical protein